MSADEVEQLAGKNTRAFRVGGIRFDQLVDPPHAQLKCLGLLGHIGEHRLQVALAGFKGIQAIGRSEIDGDEVAAVASHLGEFAEINVLEHVLFL